MNYQVGDLVYWEKKAEKVFTIEEIDNKTIRSKFTFSEVWIWSSELDIPWTSSHNKNFHCPNSHKRGRLINLSEAQRQRDRKLDELGIE